MTPDLLRPELERPLPPAIARLPVHRGYPVPWFVEWLTTVDGQPVATAIGEGEPDFRVMSSKRFAEVLRSPRCWVCGDRLTAYRAFNIGPMCAVNRVSAEPPSHRICAEWSARNCPFLSRPHMRRREAGLPVEKGENVAGVMIERNPGVALVWVTKNPRPFQVPEGSGGGAGILFNIGEPDSVSWWCEGRPATRAEVMDSIRTGLPALAELAAAEGSQAVSDLRRRCERALRLVPAPADSEPAAELALP